MIGGRAIMKIYRFDCIGRSPSSIDDLRKCETCLNEEICVGLWGGAQITSPAPRAEYVPIARRIEREEQFDRS
jgi:hypothetical protein